MCLAHWQALQVLLGSGDDLAGQGLSCTDVVGELAHLVLHGPPALAASQELHDMLSRVVAQLCEVRVQPLCRSCALRVSCSRVHCLMYVVCVLTPAQGEPIWPAQHMACCCMQGTRCTWLQCCCPAGCCALLSLTYRPGRTTRLPCG